MDLNKYSSPAGVFGVGRWWMSMSARTSTYVAGPLDGKGVLDADVAGPDDLEDEPVVVHLAHSVGDGRDVGLLQQVGQGPVTYKSSKDDEGDDDNDDNGNNINNDF